MAIQESFDLPKAKLAGVEMWRIGRLEQKYVLRIPPIFLLTPVL